MYRSRNVSFGILALFVAVIAVGLVYAGFTQTLNINGTGNVTAAKWSIHFENLSEPLLTNSANIVTPAQIKPGKTQIGDYAVTFATPGDSLTYTFDIVNEGNFDGYISGLTKTNPSCSGTDATSNSNVCKNLTYTLKYTQTGTNLAENDKLLVGESKNVTLTLTLNANMPASELPTASITVGGLGITIIYSQDSGYTVNNGGWSSTQTSDYLYSISENGQVIGWELTVNNTDVFNNYNDAIAAFGFPIFTAHVVNSDDVVTESYAGFLKGGTAYYIKGGDGGLAYSLNKQVLDTAFGASNCGSHNEGESNEYYECFEGTFDVYADVLGGVFVAAGGSRCDVNQDGDSNC